MLQKQADKKNKNMTKMKRSFGSTELVYQEQSMDQENQQEKQNNLRVIPECSMFGKFILQAQQICLLKISVLGHFAYQ